MRRSYFRLLEGVLFSLPLLFASCGNGDNALEEIINGGGSEGGGSTTVAVTGVTLNEAYLRFDKNVLTAQTLTATVAPDDATDKTVTWESSDESVATVDENGQVTPKTKGTVTITATAHDGSGMKATSTVIVYDKIVDISTDISVAAGESWLINGTGTTEDHSITIANHSKVTLNGINITKSINCTDNATIILADGSTNTVTVSTGNQAGIKIGDEATETLTIDAETVGDGQLTAQGDMSAAGIGTDRNGSGGNIVINGGTVTAIGGNNGAGIGTGRAQGVSITCGDITINGGTVTATGVDNGAGIGTGLSYGGTASNTCGAITIGTGVTMVTATKGSSAPNSIGKGSIDPVNGGNQACGKIKIGGVEYWDGAAYQNGGDNATTGLPHSPYTYTPAP
jgi:hypothetical protein